MLVLSRRASETIHFPQLQISVSILSIKGNRVQVGVDAPSQIQIVRKELQSDSEASGTASQVNANLKSSEERHAFRNRLNRAMLALELSQKQLAAGQLESAEVTLSFALARLAELEEKSPTTTASERKSFSTCITSSRSLSDSSAALSSPRLTEPIEVLLVEDDLNEQSLLKTLLEMEGYHVHTASNGIEALDCLRRNRPVGILLDMLMPECDGAATLKHIRAISQFRKLPVYAVSGTSPESVGVSIGEDGVDDWFPKPLNAPRLFQQMRLRFAHTSTL